MKKTVAIFLGLALSLSVSAAAVASEAPKEMLELKTKTAPKVYLTEAFAELRPNAIREAAQTLAIQAAVKHRYSEIVKKLEKASGHLDRVFDFRPLLLNDGKVLPPVIGEARKSFELESDTVATSTEVAYRIISRAKIVTLAPSWRDYLAQTFTSIEDVNPAVLPKNDEEKQIWEEAVEKGWAMGEAQAERVYAANLNRLMRDFKGMLRFNILVAQNVVSVPVLAEGRLGVQVGDQVLDVDQRIFRITAPTSFRKVQEWQPIFATPK